MSEPTGTLRALACGSTMHEIAGLVRRAAPERRVFPATAFLWQRGADRVLYDTGYAAEPWPRTPAVAAYRRFVPPRVGPDDTVAARLAAIGVDPASVTRVVLSHAHPDHIGGLAAFPDAELVVTAPVAALLDARPPSPARLRAGVLRPLLPPTLRRMRRRVIDRFELAPPALAGLRATDLTGDARLLAVDLPGHARGHLGLLVEGRVLLAGDAAWGRDLLGAELRAPASLVAADRRAMAATARALLRVEAGGACGRGDAAPSRVRLLFSHDRHREDVDLLEEAAHEVV